MKILPALIDQKILLVFFLLIGFSGILFSQGIFDTQKGEIRVAASVEDDVKYCVNQPSCCNDIITQLNEKGDITDLPDDQQPYHACDWPIRGYCQLSICNQLPAGKKYRGECGWYWIFHDGNTNTPDGYGCMIGDSEATMRPKYGPDGATYPPLQPTAPPTQPPPPTAIPPTNIPPTTIPLTQPIYPTAPPYYPSPTSSNPQPTTVYPTYPVWPTEPFSTSIPTYYPQPTQPPWIRPTISQYLPPQASNPPQLTINPYITYPPYPTSAQTNPTVYLPPTIINGVITYPSVASQISPQPTEVFVLITTSPGQGIWVRPTGVPAMKLPAIKTIFTGLGDFLQKTRDSIWQFLNVVLP